MAYDYAGKVVIITGGGRGLGAQITRAFARSGASILITGRNEAPLKETCDSLQREFGADITAKVADGSDEEKVKETVAWLVNKYGRIDVLINNAQALVHGVALEKQTTANFDLAFKTGVYATFYYMRACLPYLKETKGSIINMGSAAGIIGMEGFASYAATKEAIRALTRVAATEWSKYGINSNVICPAVSTPALLEWSKLHPEEYDQVMAGTPMKAFADGETHVGGTCLFLASPAGKFITGRTIDVDGGQYLRP
ncbi:MAG TPA: SDR family oxidoreductase [bacterium]|nr:SDR family oxidoreductase [bacterium]